MEEAPTKEDASDRYSEDDQNDESSEVESSQEGKGGDVNREQSEAIAKRETKFLFGMRLVVMAVLICSTCLLAYFVHKYLSTEEENEFHDKFESDAGKVLQAVGTSLDLTLGSVDALTVAMVSHAKATNQSWPFVSDATYSSDVFISRSGRCRGAINPSRSRGVIVTHLAFPLRSYWSC